MYSLNWKGLSLVILSAVLYGLMPTLARFAYTEGVNVISVLFYRYLFAFVMLSIYLFIQKTDLRIDLKQGVILSTAAVIGTVLTTYTLFLSYTYISTGLASSLHFIYPSVTTVLAILILKEPFNKHKATALALSFAGILLLSFNGKQQTNIGGIIWALTSGIFYAIYII